MKIITIIGVILFASIAFATNIPLNATTAEPPQTSALNIMKATLLSFKDLKKNNQVTIENTQQLIRDKLLSNVDIETATKLTLKGHWHTLTPSQKLLFRTYIVQSLLRDYAHIFTAYKRLDNIHISANPNVKRRDNKAIVTLTVRLNDNAKPIILTLKMIQGKQWQWHIYDVVFSGVSLIKNYQAQFNAHIRRKGLESLIDKISKKMR